jgi:hypothetical protein
MNATTELSNYSLAPALGAVTETTVYGVYVYVAGTEDRLVTATSVTSARPRASPAGSAPSTPTSPLTPLSS